MKVVITKDYTAASDWTAKYIRKKILEFGPSYDNYFILGLSSGASQLGLYKRLIEFFNHGLISFKYVKTFNTDECIGMDKDCTESTHNFMWNNFLQDTDIDPENVNIMDGNAEDLDKECVDFEAKLKEAGGVDLFIAGISPYGNIGANQTGSSLNSRTRIKSLSAETIRRNAKFYGGDIKRVPSRVLTVGIGTVMEAREVIILVTGEDHADLVNRAIEGGINHTTPITAFHQHERAIFVCDEDATLELKVRTVKHYKGLCILTHFMEFDDELDV